MSLSFTKDINKVKFVLKIKYLYIGIYDLYVCAHLIDYASNILYSIYMLPFILIMRSNYIKYMFYFSF